MQKDAIIQLIKPTIKALGLQLWGLELAQAGKHTVLRVYVDSVDNSGVTLDECTKASREISALMDVEDPIKGRYQLEVSSPGVDRPLYTAEQFARYIGEMARVKLRIAREGQRQFTGNIAAVNGDEIELNVEGTIITIAMGDIQNANLKM